MHVSTNVFLAIGKSALPLSILLLMSGQAISQYNPRSPYLNDPDLAIGYVDSCASFWIQVYDSLRGGFYTNVDRQGHVITSWGTNKNLISQSRDAYGFTRAYMLTGDERFLGYARHGLEFMEAHSWDILHGGWVDDVDQNGNQSNPAETKTAFNQHYALLGPTAYYEATRDTGTWGWLMKGYANNETKLWDASPSARGYYDNATSDWSVRSGKSFNATVDAVTTHVLPLFLLTADSSYATRLRELAAEMLQRLVGSMDQQVIGFVEGYNTDWSWDNSTGNYNTRTIMGHVLKTAWCLGRIHQLLPDTSYVSGAEKLIANVWNGGYDHARGGPYKDYDRVSGAMLMYGQDTAKAWWQMEQAVTAGLMLYNITGKEQYLQMADETADFFMKYFVDHQYGEVYSDRTANGGPIPAWGDAKGNSGKAGYHSTELGYYIYLYGKMFVKHEPATLHYLFSPQETDRFVLMNPIACETSTYRMKAVSLDGVPYADFIAGERVLHIPPSTGGHFTVSYEQIASDVAGGGGKLPATFGLSQNYPNPFNPSTRIDYRLSRREFVTLVIYDVLGRKVATVVNETKEAGEYTVRWDAVRSASGVYFYVIKAGEFVQTKKMMFLK